jgi:hypothetical protein
LSRKLFVIHLALGSVTEEDYDLLFTRFLSNNMHLISKFKNAVRLMAKNDDIDY